jgi:ParB family chromosome partitioning protein
VKTPDSQTKLVHQIVENWQRADLHPYDLADALAALRDSFRFTQKQIAELTGKPESEISRLLSLLRLNPVAQKQARDDKSGTYSRRHLIALAQLPQEDQQEAMIVVKEKRLTATDTERFVREAAANKHGVKRAGAPAGDRFRFTTSKATVMITFRRREASHEDLLTVLDEVRQQIVDETKNRKTND